MPGPDDRGLRVADLLEWDDDEAPAAPPVAEAPGDERFDEVSRGLWDGEAEVGPWAVS